MSESSGFVRMSEFARRVSALELVPFGAPLLLDLDRRQVTVATSESSMALPLTYLESEVLTLLVARCPATVSRGELVEQIWHRTADAQLRLSSVVTRLRRKLGEHSGVIQTHPGVGYSFRFSPQVEVIGRVPLEH